MVYLTAQRWAVGGVLRGRGWGRGVKDLVGGSRTGGSSRGIPMGGLWEVVEDIGNGMSTSRRTPSQHHDHRNSLVEIDSKKDLKDCCVHTNEPQVSCTPSSPSEVPKPHLRHRLFDPSTTRSSAPITISNHLHQVFNVQRIITFRDTYWYCSCWPSLMSAR